MNFELTVALYDESDTLDWPGSEGKYFLTARRCGLKAEDGITTRVMQMATKAPTRRRNDDEVEMVGNVGIGQAFGEKCVHQIRNYRLPARDKDRDGNVVDVVKEWNPANGGDNPDNRKLYEYMADERLRVPRALLLVDQADDEDLPAEVPLRQVIEGWLDMLQGRDTPAQEDFMRLGNALRASQTTTSAPASSTPSQV